MNVLVSSPEHDDITRYLRCWSRRLINKFSAKHQFYHLEKDKANRKEIEGRLKKQPIDVVLFNGHGAADRLGGHRNEIILDRKNVELLKGKAVHALSCDTAAVLGDIAIDVGARIYIGYKQPFSMYYQKDHMSEPLKDEIAALFLDAALTAPEVLLQGGSDEEAVTKTRNAFRQSIRRALNSDIQSDADKCAYALFWDLTQLTYCRGTAGKNLYPMKNLFVS